MKKQNVVLFDRSQALSEAAQRAYDEYLGKIENADPGYLLGVLAPTVHADQILPDSMRKTIYKQIAKKSGATVSTLESDRAKMHQTGDADDHLQAARDVIDSFGRKNLIACDQGLFSWCEESGVWKETSERRLKTRVHQVIGGKLTKQTVASIVDLLMTEVWREGFMFNEPSREFINAANGRLILRDGAWVLEPHRREDYMTVTIPVAYDPDATADRFAQFLVEIFDGAEDAGHRIRLVQQCLGYMLIASCHLERFFMFIGSGANGKSVLMSVMAALVGSKQTASVQPNLFSNQFNRSSLEGKLLNLVTELAVGQPISDAQLKSLVSGELIGAERKFKDPRSFRPIALHVFGTNHLPSTRDFSNALFRRASLIEFPREFSGKDRDPNLTQQLMSELPGILNIALRGLTDVLEHGFVEPESSIKLQEEWRLELDSVRRWVTECCATEPASTIAKSEAYAEYIEWARNHGVKNVCSAYTLTKRLKNLGYGEKRAANARLITGLKITERQPFR